jgi:hypothetical protein
MAFSPSAGKAHCGRSPSDRLDRGPGALTFSRELLPVDLAVRGWARSILAFSLVIGHHFMAADHGARSHADALDLAARWLLS